MYNLAVAAGVWIAAVVGRRLLRSLFREGGEMAENRGVEMSQSNCLDYPTVGKLVEVLSALPPDTRVETHGFNSIDVRLIDSVYGSRYVSLVGYGSLAKPWPIDNYS